jgi:hypothetical protein
MQIHILIKKLEKVRENISPEPYIAELELDAIIEKLKTKRTVRARRSQRDERENS